MEDNIAQLAASMTIDEKRTKIKTNYETIEVLKNRLEERNRKERVGMTRAAYIKMIFDVTKKFDKQNDELSKAILETRRLQRDISNLSGRLERSFTLVESTILKNAESDVWSRECYKMLGEMHDNCDQLVKAVHETGELTREVRQLEDQIGQIRLSHMVDTKDNNIQAVQDSA